MTQTIVFPWLDRSFRTLAAMSADAESRPEVGSSRNKSGGLFCKGWVSECLGSTCRRAADGVLRGELTPVGAY
eukprot:COSAG05_NODE_20900_length_276_cov_0.576271_1_plen_72_part_10